MAYKVPGDSSKIPFETFHVAWVIKLKKNITNLIRIDVVGLG